MKIEIYHIEQESCECCRWQEAEIEIIIDGKIVDTYRTGKVIYDIDDVREILKDSPYTDFSEEDVTGYY